MQLSICCVTQALPRSIEFLVDIQALATKLDAELVFGAHGDHARLLLKHELRVVPVGGDYMEQMLDLVLDACSGRYILRLDDDERCSPGMIAWLLAGTYRERPVWHFRRPHLMPDADHYIATSPFYPDWQTRLTAREFAKRPMKLHAACPHPGWGAPKGVEIEHWTFLVKTREERVAIHERYATHAGVVFDKERALPEGDPGVQIAPWTREVAP